MAHPGPSDSRPPHEAAAGAGPVVWLTAGEAAVVAKVHERTIRRAIARGDLKATRVRGRLRITRDNLHDYQQRQRQGSTAPRRPARARRLATLSSLPVPPTAIIGRERDVRLATALLTGPDGRLLTLTGPGGVGKTRLALAVAANLASSSGDGVVFVPLEAVRDPAQVAAAIAQTLGIAPGIGMDHRATLIEAVRHYEQLIILDNFEQVLGAAALVAELLSFGSGIRILVTSREALRIRGETEIVVNPLAVPDLAGRLTAEAVARAPAIELFVRCARAVQPDFTLNDDNAGLLGEICHRLDGLPLAIELAASQIKHASLPELRSRLTRRLDALAAGSRDLPDRLRTMRAAIGWSYDLLDADEQAVFRRLSVFAGGFTLEAAAAICDPLGQSARSIQATIDSLVNKSLVHRVEIENASRFAMLDTIRAFAGEQLVSNDEDAEFHHRHAAYFLSLAEAASNAFHGPDEIATLARLEREFGNVRAALAWSASAAQSLGIALRLANAMAWPWYVRGHQQEGWRWFALLLDRADEEFAPHDHARALIFASWLAVRLGMPERAEQLCADALMQTEHLALRPENAFAESTAGFVRLYGFGDPATAKPHFQAALLKARSTGDGWVEAMSEYGLSIVALADGDLAQATAFAERGLARSRAMGDVQGAATNLAQLGRLARIRGDLPSALRITADALDQYLFLDDRGNVCSCIESLAGLLVAIGRLEQGTMLFGTASAFRQRIGTPVPGHEQTRYEADVAVATQGLVQARFQDAWLRGEAMALQETLSGIPWRTMSPYSRCDAPRPAGASLLRTLTRRERQILELIGAGHTDRQIGDLLAISPATVTKHVGNALAKLGAPSRTAAAVLLLTTTI
ncbi:MAG: LuxR C-terminal-related transcriptional regulator [Thermomicrobiales bacterium]